MNKLNDLIAQMTNLNGIMSAAYQAAKMTPIRPFPTYPVHADTIVITWSDYAVCRQ